jgi:hypothetical protein
VRVFVNPALHSSLAAGSKEHPVDAAAVKELYGSGTTILGWSTMRRTQTGSGGQHWWWYEVYQGKHYAASQGATFCTNCHGAGQDHFLSPFPLQ